MRIAAVLLPLMAVPFVFPLFSEQGLVRYDLFTDIPLIGLAILTCLAGLDRITNVVERRFWRLLSIAWSCWLGIRVLNVIVREETTWDYRISLLVDGLYAFFYLFMVLAFELRPSSRNTGHSSARTLSTMGAAVFVFGTFIYLGVIPSLSLEVVDSAAVWFSGFVMYAVLDIFLVVQLASHLYTCESKRWRNIYTWLLLTTVFWTITDGSFAIEEMGWLLDPTAQAVLEFMWMPPFLTFFIAAGLKKLPEPDPEELSTAAAPPFLQSLWGGPLIIYAIAFPTIHFSLDTTEILSADSRVGRQACVIVVLVILTGMAFVYQKLLEAENQRLKEEQRDVNEQIKLAERMESIGRLAGGVAHDFNNLLQIIRICSDSLINGLPTGSHHRRHAEEISMATDRAAILTDQLLTFSRRKLVEPKFLQINKTVIDMVSMLRRVIGDDIELETGIDENAGLIYVDRGQLERAMLNLAVNARDAMPDGGRLSIKTEVVQLDEEYARLHGDALNGPFIVLSVADTGVGMSPEIQSSIFDPFFTTKPAGKGTGLGLSMIYGFVMQSGGHVEVTSAPGKGTTFELFFPIVQAKPDSNGHPGEPDRDTLRGSETILVVENERPVRSAVCSMLSEGGYHVLEASNGMDALRLLEESDQPVQLLLTDVMMPEMSGYELADRLSESHPDLRVLFMTGRVSEIVPFQKSASKSGERRPVVLEKPFTRDNLALRIRETLA